MVKRVFVVLAMVLAVVLGGVPGREVLADGSGEVFLGLLGRVGGEVRAVAVEGEHAYVGMGSRLVVVDVSDPEKLEVLGQTRDLEGSIEDVEISEGRAYVIVGEQYSQRSLQVVDVSDPGAPKVKGRCELAEGVVDAVVSGEYVYVIAGGELQVVRVSDPMAPEIVEDYNLPGYNATSVAISGEYVYVTAEVGWRERAFYVVDISDPVAPELVGTCALSGRVGSMVVSGRYVYLTGLERVCDEEYPREDAYLYVVDVLAPGAPEVVGQCKLRWSGEADEVLAAGRYVYVVQSSEIVIVDVADPTKPAEVDGWQSEWGGWLSCFDAELSGEHIYMAVGWGGLQVLDVSEPTVPQAVDQHDLLGSIGAVAVLGEHAYVAAGSGGLGVLSVSDPAAPTVVGWCALEGGVRDIVASGEYVYVTGWWNLQVVDVSNPAVPKMVGQCRLEGAGGVAISGEYAYVTGGGWENGERVDYLYVVDVSAPTAPRKVGQCELSGDLRDVAIAGEYAYVSGRGALWVVDISNPRVPEVVGHCELPRGDTGVGDVVVSGRYAYVAAGENGLWVVDISDPTAPEVAVYKLRWEARGIALSGGYIYMVGPSLRVVDVSELEALREVANYELPFYALGVAVVGDRVYVADDTGGLYILGLLSPRHLYLPLILGS